MAKVLVDSSVWIDLTRGKSSPHVKCLRDLIVDKRVLLGDLVLLEVLQGFRSDREFEQVRDSLLAFESRSLGGSEIALLAADYYRSLRAKGITVRKSIDMLIGAYCIKNNIALLHNDRDFDPLEQHLGLKVYRGL